MQQSSRKDKAGLLKDLRSGKLSIEAFKDAAKKASGNYLDLNAFESWLRSGYPQEADKTIEDLTQAAGDTTKMSTRTLNLLVLFSEVGPKFFEYLKASSAIEG